MTKNHPSTSRFAIHERQLIFVGLRLLSSPNQTAHASYGGLRALSATKVEAFFTRWAIDVWATTSNVVIVRYDQAF